MYIDVVPATSTLPNCLSVLWRNLTNQLALSIGNTSKTLVDPSVDDADYQFAYLCTDTTKKLREGRSLWWLYRNRQSSTDRWVLFLTMCLLDANLIDFGDIIAAATGGGDQDSENPIFTFHCIRRRSRHHVTVAWQQWVGKCSCPQILARYRDKTAGSRYLLLAFVKSCGALCDAHITCRQKMFQYSCAILETMV